MYMEYVKMLSIKLQICYATREVNYPLCGNNECCINTSKIKYPTGPT